MEIKTYTLSDYAEKVAKKHINTVLSYINKGLLPSNHQITKGKQYFITVIPQSQKEISETIETACAEFHRLSSVVGKESEEQKQFKRELAAEICVKYKINTNKFFKIQGL